MFSTFLNHSCFDYCTTYNYQFHGLIHDNQNGSAYDILNNK